MPIDSITEANSRMLAIVEEYDPATKTLGRDLTPDFDPTKDRAGLQAEMTLWAATAEGIAAIKAALTA